MNTTEKDIQVGKKNLLDAHPWVKLYEISIRDPEATQKFFSDMNEKMTALTTSVSQTETIRLKFSEMSVETDTQEEKILPSVDI